MCSMPVFVEAEKSALCNVLEMLVTNDNNNSLEGCAFELSLTRFKRVYERWPFQILDGSNE